MEKDDELKGKGNNYTTEFRQYDPRIGRWLSIDPLVEKFPSHSPFNYCLNNPLNKIDPKGDAPQDWIRRNNSNRWEYDSRVQSQKNAIDKYGEGTEYKNDGDTYQGLLGTKDIGAVKLNTGGLQTWDGGSYQNKDLNPNLSWNAERLLNPFKYNWYENTSKGNTLVGTSFSLLELSNISFRLTNGVANGSAISPKFYSSGWAGGSRAGIKTYNSGNVAKGLGRASFALGVGMDAIGVLNYYTEGADSRNSVHPAKAIVNTGFGVLGLKWNPVAAILYSGVDTFYPGGWLGDGRNEGAIRGVSKLIESNQEIVPNFNIYRDIPGGY
jgi:RHS repeat-associated protein